MYTELKTESLSAFRITDRISFVVSHLHFVFIKFHGVSINMQIKRDAFHITDTSLLLDSATLHEKQNYNTFTFVWLSSCFTSP